MDNSKSFTLLQVNVFLIVVFLIFDINKEEERQYIKYILAAAGLLGLYSSVVGTKTPGDGVGDIPGDGGGDIPGDGGGDIPGDGGGGGDIPRDGDTSFPDDGFVRFGQVVHVSRFDNPISRLGMLNTVAFEYTINNDPSQLKILSVDNHIIGSIIQFGDKVRVVKAGSPGSQLKMKEGNAYEVNDEDEPKHTTFKIEGLLGDGGLVKFGDKMWIEKDGKYQLKLHEGRASEEKNERNRVFTQMTFSKYVPWYPDPLTVVQFGDIIFIGKFSAPWYKLALFEGKGKEVQDEGTNTRLQLISTYGKEGPLHYGEEIIIPKHENNRYRLKLKGGDAYETDFDGDELSENNRFYITGFTGFETGPVVYGDKIWVEKIVEKGALELFGEFPIWTDILKFGFRSGSREGLLGPMKPKKGYNYKYYNLKLRDQDASEIREDKNDEDTQLTIIKYIPKPIDPVSNVKYGDYIHIGKFSAPVYKLSLYFGEGKEVAHDSSSTQFQFLSAKGKTGFVEYNEDLHIVKVENPRYRLKMKQGSAYEEVDEVSENTTFQLVGFTGNESGVVNFGEKIWVEKVGKYQLSLLNTEAKEKKREKDKDETQLAIYKVVPKVIDPNTLVKYGDYIRIGKFSSPTHKLDLFDGIGTTSVFDNDNTLFRLESLSAKTGPIHYNEELLVIKVVAPQFRLKMKSGNITEGNEVSNNTTMTIMSWSGHDTGPVIYGNKIWIDKLGKYQLGLYTSGEAKELSDDKHKEETQQVIIYALA